MEQPHVWKLVESAKFFYISGFFLTVSPETIAKVGQHAADTNKTFMMNLAAPFISEVPIFKDRLMASSEYWLVG